MESIELPAQWEVWSAWVKYEEEPSDGKSRPVLVLDADGTNFLSLKITSKPPRSNCEGEYALEAWQEAGLRKPSTVRISKMLNLVQRDFGRKIGNLSPIDMRNITKELITLKFWPHNNIPQTIGNRTIQ